ncbi:MAG: SCP2 sterol-binding domain-containing protein [Actinomycetota bacterium]
MTASAEEMYEVARQMFGSFLDNPKMVETARKTNSVLRYTFTGPTVKITVNNRRDPVEVLYGDCEVTPDVTISMDWKVAHEFLMGRANAADLFLKKKISVHPMSQAPRYMRLVPMFMGLLKRYPEIIEEMGLADAMEGK